MIGGTVFLGALLPFYLHFFPVQSIIPSFKDMGYLVILVVFCTVGLYIIFAEVLKTIPAFTVNLTFNLEPVYSIILAFIFFNESKQVNLAFYIGLSLIVTSVVMQTLISVKRK
ncbi:EamA family transporter [Chryseobacterium piperi]|uniref:EamA family transporter n=1 Tax=Chryseobacterium piperi TaxID=558152 RepID=UPI000AA23347|nr:EamA family transporter [Chryseobacterium piperi]